MLWLSQQQQSSLLLGGEGRGGEGRRGEGGEGRRGEGREGRVLRLSQQQQFSRLPHVV